MALSGLVGAALGFAGGFFGWLGYKSFTRWYDYLMAAGTGVVGAVIGALIAVIIAHIILVRRYRKRARTKLQSYQASLQQIQEAQKAFSAIANAHPFPVGIAKGKAVVKHSTVAPVIETGETYVYEAMDGSGAEVKGEVSASTSQDAIAQLRLQGMFPTKVRQVRRQ